MAASIDSRVIMRPELCDIVKSDWARDTLPDDGALQSLLQQHETTAARPG